MRPLPAFESVAAADSLTALLAVKVNPGDDLDGVIAATAAVDHEEDRTEATSVCWQQTDGGAARGR